MFVLFKIWTGLKQEPNIELGNNVWQEKEKKKQKSWLTYQQGKEAYNPLLYYL